MGKNVLVKLGSIGVAIIVAIGIYFVKSKGEEKIEQAKAPDVGQCVHFEKDGTEDKPVDAKCGDAKSSHKVVGDKGACGENETTYQVTRSGSSSGAIVELCLVWDAKKGDCFDTDESKVDCAAAKGSPSIKIVSVGKISARCAKPAEPLDYPKRDLRLCAVPNA